MDDEKAYVTYYASWHGTLLGSGENSDALRPWLRRIIAAQVIILISEHPILALFFMLPDFRFSRARKRPPRAITS